MFSLQLPPAKCRRADSRCNHHPPLGIGLGMVAHVKDEEWKPWKKEVKSLVLVALAVVGSDFVERCWLCLMELLMGGK